MEEIPRTTSAISLRWFKLGFTVKHFVLCWFLDIRSSAYTNYPAQLRLCNLVDIFSQKHDWSNISPRECFRALNRSITK